MTKRLALFMARGPYRFLCVLLFGVAVVGLGTWHDWDKLLGENVRVRFIVVGGLAFYLVASGAYGYLIYTDRWKSAFWDVVIKAMHNPRRHS